MDKEECEAMGGIWVSAHKDKYGNYIHAYCREKSKLERARHVNKHAKVRNNFEGAKIMKKRVAEYRISREPDKEGFYRFSVTSNGKTESGIAHSYDEARDRAINLSRKIARKRN